MNQNYERVRISSEAPQATGKKILFATVPADGHFSPLTGIAKHLQSLGYDVRWYTSKEYADKLTRLEIPHYKFETALEVTGTNMDEVFPTRAGIKNPIKKLNFDIINFFVKRGPEYYADIKSIHKEFPFDLMIADNVFTGTPFVSDKMEIPVISIGVLPLTETSKDLAPSGLGLTPSNSLAGKIKQAFLRFFTENVLFRPANKILREIMDRYQIEHKNIGLFDMLVRKSTLLLQSGTPGFEYQRSDLGKNIRFIGSLLPYNSGKRRAPWYDQRLNQYEKIVLVTQGTVEKDVEKLLVPALEAFKDSDTLVIVTTGGSQTKELQERYPDQNFIIRDFIHFEDVMPYADVYITNGGYGGVMLGIENKLPMVVAGVHEGKNEINARIGYFKLGINLKTEKPKPDQLWYAVEKVMNDPIYKYNVENLSEEFESYNPNELTACYVKQVLSTVSTEPVEYLN